MMFSSLVDVLESIFVAGYEISGSYGLAVIILSLVVNTLLWPAYHVVERLKSGQQSRFRGMLTEIDEIKACYSGRERHYYIKAIQRRYGYGYRHRAILFIGLAIEVLFFVAAYEMLTSFSGFHGEPFWFIADLGLPDAIYTAGSLSVNVLPIVMTLLNLLSSSLYSGSGQDSERGRLWILAALFLVVLYEAPAALTLYWVANNTVALAKQIIPAIYSGDRSVLRRISRAVAKTRDRLGTTDAAVMGFGTACYLFVAALQYQHTLHGPATDFFITIALLALVFGLFSGRGIATLGRCESRPIQAALLAGTGGPLLVLLYLLGATLSGSPPADITPAALVLAFTVPAGFLALAIRGHNQARKGRQRHSGQMLSLVLALGYIGSSVFLWLPLAVYASSPDEFAFSPATLLLHNLPWFIACLLLLSLPALFFTGYRDKALAIVPALAAGFFVYAYILPIDFGSLEGFVLDRPVPFDHNLGVYLAECLVMLFLVAVFLNKIRGKILLGVLLTINVAAAGEGLYQLLGTRSGNTPSSATGPAPSGVTNEVFGLSKNGRNLVIIILDGFNTSFVDHIFDDQAQLKESFAGFVFYPNTISASYYTNSTMPVIVGGWNYTPDRMNALDGDTLAWKSNRVYEDSIADLLRRQYAPAFVEPTTYRVGSDDGFANIAAMAPTLSAMQLGNYWEALHGGDDSADHPTRQIDMLTAVALFRSVPLAVKPLIYRQGKWLNPDSSAYLHARNHYAILDLLPTLSSTAGDHDTYKIIYSGVTHRPYAVSAQGELMKSGVPDPTAYTSYGGLNAYYSARWSFGALARYFAWLRQAGVYDNTRIILVSDHGNNYSLENSVGFRHKELLPALELTELEANRIGALLMVKDFHANGPFTQNRSLMSNGDVRDIALGERPLPRAHETEERILHHHRTLLWKTSDMYRERRYEYDRIYRIESDYSDLSRWTLVKNGSEAPPPP